MQPKDTLLVSVSDFHSGSNYALFLAKEWRGRKGATHIPNSQQVEIRKQFEAFAASVKEARKGKRVKLVHNGDSHDGDHHNSGDVCTRNQLEQADIHIRLMSELQKRIDWQRGDELYYTRGTQTHVNEYENYIGREMNAVMCGDFYVWDLLQLNVNDVLIWYVHHGPKRGDGPNEGNPMRNWLRAIYFNALKDKTKIPDIVFTGHVHDPTYSSYVYREEMNFKVMHGVILPSWQQKTAFSWQVAGVNRNKIGGAWMEIKADGTIALPRFSVAVEKFPRLPDDEIELVKVVA